MNRVIKFRAWNSAEHGMYQNVGIIPSENGYKAADSIGGLILDMYGSQPTVMQFTGFHDKHGKEAFFGDILDDPGTEGHYPHDDRWLLEEDEDDFGASLSPVGNYCYPWRKDRLKQKIANMEIVGNIYENPELARRPS